MDFFSKLEKLSEKLIEGIFKTKLPGQLQPLEIAAQLYQEMKEKKQISLTKVYAPNRYLVFVNPQDWAELAPLEAPLVKELTAYLVKKAKEKEFHLGGNPVISFEGKEGLIPGRFQVEGHFTESLPVADAQIEPEPQAAEEGPLERTQVFKGLSMDGPDEQRPRAEMVVLEGSDPGLTFRLQAHKMIIGRRTTNDIYLDDDKVSRQHAEVTLAGGSYYISDLDSLNGTFVNNGKVAKKKLEPGDKITLGSSVIEFRVV